MTTNWKCKETAGGAGAEAPRMSVRISAAPSGRIRRALRWKKDAVCRESAAAAADPAKSEQDAMSVPGVEADSAGSSLTRTIFFSSRIQTQPTTRKETPNTTQEKKGKQKQNKYQTRNKLETLA